MKKSGKCPKCDGCEIVKNADVLIPARGSVRLSIESDPGAFLMKDAITSELEAFVCVTCGFTELYALKPADLSVAQNIAERNSRSK